ncbi:MAG: hypothetical protein QE263_06495 [Vampirovibrionales bacterium]|nr:hypothetical protein [Vampirovibrionales bacterium]
MQLFRLGTPPRCVTFGKHIETKQTPQLHCVSVSFTKENEQLDLEKRALKAQETLGDNLQWVLTRTDAHLVTPKQTNYNVVFILRPPLWKYLATLPNLDFVTGFHRLLSIQKDKTQTDKQLTDYLKPSYTVSTLLPTLRTHLDQKG